MLIEDRPQGEPGSSATTAVTSPAREAHGRYRIGLRYGRVIYRLRWLIIAVWLVALATSVPFAARIGSVLTSSGNSTQHSESATGAAILQAKLRTTPTQVRHQHR